ncbi:MAG: hypothetical protein Q8O33_12910 [Pseudomonadota bacterium]|nr:hypothetical protein [Pseudomonadota bacterium]
MKGLPDITCPVCQAEYSLEVALGQDDARGVVRELARCPADAGTRKALLRYCALHAPATQRLRWNRVESMLAEINGWMETGRIERGGRLWAAPASAYLSAIETIESMPTLRRPLKGHGLLLEVLSGMTAKADARAEQDRITRGRGETPVAQASRLPASKDAGKDACATQPRTRSGTAAGLQSLRDVLAGANPPQPPFDKGGSETPPEPDHGR